MKRQQFEEWLADQLESFRIRQEGKILHIPRLVRDVTLRDFAKYRGDIQECLKGLQRERLGGEVGAIDRTTRKRKWIESQETEVVKETDVSTSEGSKGMKSGKLLLSWIPLNMSELCNSPHDDSYSEEGWSFECTRNWTTLATSPNENSKHGKRL